ncbi:Homoserine kinase [Frankliniella fusca]|uniref:Homoserine kinase n=1 Tax=Frankliniella fusca TaxID=407009 RepID=A0AAE1I432_9NEOP|nr:Homoserine kinase [Frankliniella fusca]
MFSQGRKLLKALQEQNHPELVPPPLPQPERELTSPPQSKEKVNTFKSFFSQSEKQILNTQYVAAMDALHEEQPFSSPIYPDIPSGGLHTEFEREITLSSEFGPGTHLVASEISPKSSQVLSIASVQTVKKKLFLEHRPGTVNCAEITPDDEQCASYSPIILNSRKRLPFGSPNSVDADLGIAPLDMPIYTALTTVNFEHVMTSEVPPTDLTLDVNQKASFDFCDAVQNEEDTVPMETMHAIVSPNISDVSTQDFAQVEEVVLAVAEEDISLDTIQGGVVEPNVVTVDSESLKKTKRVRQAVATTSTPPRKRQRNPLLTKAAKIKTAYNLGIAHTTTRGKLRPARSMRPGCNGKCRRGCQGKISQETRQRLFKSYYSSGSKSAQWLMLARYVKPLPVKRRTVVEDSPLRKTSYEYLLPNDSDQLIPVCQTMFIDTFDISITVVNTAMKKNSPDKRGKHTENKRRTPPTLIQGVKEHIKSFPKIESHYCREETKREYLQENLSVSKMYRLYIMSRGLNAPDTATLRQYQDIFNNCFNLGFYKPKKDQCSLCVRYDAVPVQERDNHLDLIKEWTEHTEAKVLVRNLRKEVKALSRSEDKKGTMKVICFDLQKVFFCPKSEVGEFFYKRKISCYNFTIFDCTLKQATCFVWDQTIGGRGAAEISSCVHMYIEQEVANGVKEFHVYSDSCWSQNKNQILYTMYNLLSKKYNIKIIHRYLQKGHTQMECDSVHARIEKKTRSTDIFTPKEWYGFIRTAKVKRPMYTVIEVTQENILNFKDIAKSQFLWEKVPISKVHEIVIDPATPGTITYKKKLSDQGISCYVQSKKPGRPFNWVSFKAPKLYSGPLPLKAPLVKDLKWMISQKLIPERALPFYIAITSPDLGAVCENEDDDYPLEVQVDDFNLESQDESAVDTPAAVVVEEGEEDGDSSGSEIYD